jgi:hypothetical protein
MPMPLPRRFLRRLAPMYTGLALALAAGSGCGETNNPDPGTCPSSLPLSPVTCTLPDCNLTTGAKLYGETTVQKETSDSWLVVSHVSSEVLDNENLEIEYGLEEAGALRAARRRASKALQLPSGPSGRFEAQRRRVDAEANLRSWQRPDLAQSGNLTGTAIRRGQLTAGLTVIRAGQATCSETAPACPAKELCVIPNAQTTGSCESVLSLKFRTDVASFVPVTATVERVGTFGAIVVDEADTVSDANLDALLARFEDRIAPVDHALFGRAVNAQGLDRDRNGVVILFITSRVGSISPDLVGFFQADDLVDPATLPVSNGADILYLQPPSTTITLDSLSGTIGHEYQHLINAYAKVVNRGSSQETVWLDEGLSSFAEDILGYGGDAFANIALYLANVENTSLTGNGLINTSPNSADSAERRGMGHLLVRYLYEQQGAARLGPGPGDIVDDGGAGAVKALVQSADTGIDLFSQTSTGRSFDSWLDDLLTMVALDDAGFSKAGCQDRYRLRDAESDTFTGFQRGLRLRTSIRLPTGDTLPLNGPSTATLANEQVPIPSNGGEIRTLKIVNNPIRLTLRGPAEDFSIGFRVIAIGE